MASGTSSSSLRLIISSLLLLLCNCSCANAHSKSAFDSIYQFGDSISDTGNQVREIPWSSCSKSPYGQTFFHKPTGRCSNGLLMVDYFARAFKLPLLNPYLQRDADFSNGVNFAVAGATARNASKYPGSSLPVQLEWFRSFVNSTCSSPPNCKKKFEKALFIMGEIGGNDYNYVLVDSKSIPIAVELVPEVVQSITNAVKEVISYGASHVVVPGNFPIGCTPIFLHAFKTNDSKMYDDFGCFKSLNSFSSFHNKNLKKAIKELQKEYPSVKFYYGDYYSAFTWVLHNAASLGFDKDKLFRPCCGTITHMCGSGKDAPLCEDPKKRISWDGTHQTQESYKNLAKWLLSNTFHKITPLPSPSSSPTQKASGADHVVSLVVLRVVVGSILALWAIGSDLF